jgi:Fe-S cluster assembly protein SufD
MTIVVNDRMESKTKRAGTPEPGWVDAIRHAGAARFAAVGYPTAKVDAWKDTNVSLLAKTEFAPAPPIDAPGAASVFKKASFGPEAAAEIVFVNGVCDAALSRLDKLPKGVSVVSLRDALQADGALARKHLAQHAKIDANPFVALNSSQLNDGVLITFARHAVCEKPLHVIYLTLAGATPIVTHPRTLVVMEEQSQGSIVETYAGDDAGLYFTNAVTEIVLAPHTHLDHNKLQQEGAHAYHIATQEVVNDSQAVFVSHSTSLGSKLTRNDLNVTLNGDAAEATLNGLVMIRGDQHVDNHTLLHHEKPNCPSHELYKHVLADKATGVFKGKIFVQKDAQKTNSKQTSKTLLLSKTAFMNSQPALEIYADDVKCTHGATIGPVDEEAVFYLVSRGLAREQARQLMTYAFAADITRRIKIAAVRARIEDTMAQQAGLPQDLRINDLSRHDTPLQ